MKCMMMRSAARRVDAWLIESTPEKEAEEKEKEEDVYIEVETAVEDVLKVVDKGSRQEVEVL